MDAASSNIAPVPMKPWRICMVLVVAGVITSWHLYDIITQTEQWPFSYYQMYARVEKKRSVSVLSLYAVIKRDGKRHVMRVTDAPDIPQIPALTEGRLRVILMSAWNRPPGNDVQASNQVLADYIRLYETKRLSGEIEGPQILEARLYKVTWKLNKDGSRRTRPTSSELLTSVVTRDVWK